jgi:chromosome segregation ATPase
MLSVHNMLLQQKEMEKVTLEGECVKASEERKSIEQEMMSLRSENIEQRKLIEQLKDDIEKHKNTITGVQGVSQEYDLSKYVKLKKPVPGPTGPLESLWGKIKK